MCNFLLQVKHFNVELCLSGKLGYIANEGHQTHKKAKDPISSSTRPVNSELSKSLKISNQAVTQIGVLNLKISPPYGIVITRY